MDESQEEKPSFWTLPNKDQIFYLVICRVVEPLAYSSIAPYIYYMVRDFGYDDPSEIAVFVTLIMTSFSLGQAVTAVSWGRFSDSKGRKPSLLLGLVGTAFSIILFGTATNVYVAMLGRFLSGALNGNIGVLRTMLAELVGDRKEYQTRAFAILPITFNIGTIVGPMIGGLLADPAGNYPGLFGWSTLLRKYPYLLPNLFPLPFIVVSFLSTLFFVHETSTMPGAWLPTHRDPGLALGLRVKRYFLSRRDGYESIPNTADGEEAVDPLIQEPQDALPVELGDEGESHHSQSEVTEAVTSSEHSTNKHSRPSIRSVLTQPVKVTLAAYVIIMLHSPSFMQLFPLFLSTPRQGKEAHENLLFFNGGLGMKTSEIGMIISVMGVSAVILQLMVYPRLASYIGVAKLHKITILVYLPTYFLIPFLSFLPVEPESLTFFTATALAGLYLMGRTFAIPPMTVLITNASPSRRVLGTVHGLCHSVTSVARTAGPFVLGSIYSLGVKWNMIGLAWWVMSLIVVVEIFVASQLREWGDEVKDEEQEQLQDTNN